MEGKDGQQSNDRSAGPKVSHDADETVVVETERKEEPGKRPERERKLPVVLCSSACC